MNSVLREFDEEKYRKMLEEESRRDGIEAGTERVNQLIRLLAEQSRTEDIIRSANDKEYQKKFFEEYGI